MATESIAIDPKVAEQARLGQAPYPGQEAPKAPDAPLQTTENPVRTEPFLPTQQQPKTTTPAEAPAKPADDAAQAAEAEPAKADDAAEASPQEIAEAAGLDYAALYSEWREQGTLSEASLAGIKKAFPGVPDEIIGTYLAGLGAINVLAVQQAHAVVGGSETYGAMIQWAAANLPEHEINAFNAALDGGDASMQQAIKGLHARYQNAKGGSNEPDLSVQGARASGEPPIRSRQELVALIRDPRFAKDPAWRAEVEKRAAIAAQHPDYRTY